MEAAAAAATAAAAPQLTAFQQQLADLEQQRAAMTAANEAYRVQAETRAATQAVEMQGLMTGLTNLQLLVASNQKDANDRMAAADATFCKFQQDMIQAAAKATADRIADQQQSKSQFDHLMAAITGMKQQNAQAAASSTDEDKKEDAPPKKARIEENDSEASNSRSRSSQRGGSQRPRARNSTRTNDC